MWGARGLKPRAWKTAVFCNSPADYLALRIPVWQAVGAQHCHPRGGRTRGRTRRWLRGVGSRKARGTGCFLRPVRARGPLTFMGYWLRAAASFS